MQQPATINWSIFCTVVLQRVNKFSQQTLIFAVDILYYFIKYNYGSQFLNNKKQNCHYSFKEKNCVYAKICRKEATRKIITLCYVRNIF
jgi:hypothetical protein